MRGKVSRRGVDKRAWRDHPRLCGEKRCTGNFSGHDDGSPPPMRGKVKPFLCPLCHKGITPAYAGKSLFTFRKVMRLRDHPRLCGEKYSVYFLPLYGIGSPPPMRGKVIVDPVAETTSRITPAYAGKSVASAYTLRSSWDHPRLCGEKTIKICLTLWKTGSPPPMRGKASPTRKLSRLLRITPAYAGKRQFSAFPLKFVWDHPRLCGEKLSDTMSSLFTLGSPPPMRGKAFLVCQCDYSTGITPAYAGKSLIPVFFGGRFEDHPRLCGEKTSSIWTKSMMRGSPPPMRGKGTLFEQREQMQRITPAYAGKRTLNRKGQTRNLGSPPPMRGKDAAFFRKRL